MVRTTEEPIGSTRAGDERAVCSDFHTTRGVFESTCALVVDERGSTRAWDVQARRSFGLALGSTSKRALVLGSVEPRAATWSTLLVPSAFRMHAYKTLGLAGRVRSVSECPDPRCDQSRE